MDSRVKIVLFISLFSLTLFSSELKTHLKYKTLSCDERKDMISHFHYQRSFDTNKAFTNNSKFSFDEVYGKNPRILSSQVHDIKFYQDMWYEINTNGFWRGEIINKTKDGVLYTEPIHPYNPELLNQKYFLLFVYFYF